MAKPIGLSSFVHACCLRWIGRFPAQRKSLAAQWSQCTRGQMPGPRARSITRILLVNSGAFGKKTKRRTPAAAQGQDRSIVIQQYMYPLYTSKRRFILYRIVSFRKTYCHSFFFCLFRTTSRVCDKSTRWSEIDPKNWNITYISNGTCMRCSFNFQSMQYSDLYS